MLFALLLACLIPFAFLIYSRTSGHSHQQRASRSFVPVVATVVESRVLAGKTRWSAKVSYRYAVGGKTYLSSEVSYARTEMSGLLRGGPSRAGASATAAEHPIGSTLYAYYDPANPSDALLDRSPPVGSPWVPIMWLLVLVALGSLLGVVPRTLGPRIPDPWVIGAVRGAGVSAFAGAIWFLLRVLRGSGREDVGTAFALIFIGSLLVGSARLLRSGRDAA